MTVRKPFWHFDFMSVITVGFRSNISKDWKHKTDDNCQTGREQARIHFIAMAAVPWQGEKKICSLSFSPQVGAEWITLPQKTILVDLEYYV